MGLEPCLGRLADPNISPASRLAKDHIHVVLLSNFLGCSRLMHCNMASGLLVQHSQGGLGLLFRQILDVCKRHAVFQQSVDVQDLHQQPATKGT